MVFVIKKRCEICNKYFKTKCLWKKVCSNKCRLIKRKKYDQKRYPKRKDYLKKNSLKYYHKNKNKILPKQIAYKMKRYKKDLKFKEIDNVRKYTAHCVPLKNMHCQYCNSKINLQRHHPDYKIWYAIVFLCKKCHKNA